MALDRDEGTEVARHFLGAHHPEPLEPDLAFHVGHDPGGQVLHAVRLEPGGEVVGPVGFPVVLDHVRVGLEQGVDRGTHHHVKQTVHVIGRAPCETDRVEEFVLSHDSYSREEGLVLCRFQGVFIGSVEHAGQVFNGLVGHSVHSPTSDCSAHGFGRPVTYGWKKTHEEFTITIFR